MREDIRRKKYKMLHNKINECYCKDFLNVKQSCKKAGITTSVYYKICKELGRKSVGTPIKTKQKSNTNAQNSNDKSTKSHTSAREKLNSHRKKAKNEKKMRGGDPLSMDDDQFDRDELGMYLASADAKRN